jgi:hypothetical protein
MKLKQYDGQCVRIDCVDGNVYDGICSYNDKEYDEQEYGRPEECLVMVNFLFFKSDIVAIESLENHTGPYGKFHDPFGKLEEMNVQDGLNSILDFLDCEDPEHILRMLRCLDYYFDPKNCCDFPCRWEAYGAIMELEDSTDDEIIKREAGRILDKWRPMESTTESSC